MPLKISGLHIYRPEHRKNQDNNPASKPALRILGTDIHLGRAPRLPADTTSTAPRRNATNVAAPTTPPFLTSFGQASGVQATSAVGSATALNVESMRLDSAVHRFRHPQHGELSISRFAKASDESSIAFSLKLQAPGASSERMEHELTVSNRDPVSGKATLSYWMLVLPDSMRGKGVIWAYHAAAAEAARALNVDQFAVKSVGDPGLRSVCERCGMTRANDLFEVHDYCADPYTVAVRARTQMAAHGWSPS